jgi:hypothetical protein
LTATGGTGALTWTLAPLKNFLPPGLSLSSAGVISGTSTASGQYVFTVVVTDASSRTQSRTFNLSIYCATCTPPLFLDAGPNFGPISIGRFTVQLAATGGAAPYHYSLTPGATVVPGMRVQDGAPLPTSFPSNVTGGYIGVLTAPGTYNTSIRVTDSTGATFDRAITVSVVGFNFVSQTTPPKPTVGTPYSFTVQVYPSAGNYAWSATGLPAGLGINASTGTISGTPTVNGTFTPTVTLTDVATSKSISQTLTLNVDKFAITTASPLPQGTVGVPYNATLAAPGCGGTCTWTLGSSLPSGLSLSTGGVIAGTPTASFNGSVTINASGSNGSVQKRFGLVIAGNTPAPLMITIASSFANTVGVPITNALSAFGGTPPYVSWSVQSGSLPPGITLQGPGNALGALLNPTSMYLAGRAMVVGTYNFTLAVTDSANVTTTQAITWNVSHLSNEYSSLPLPGRSLTYNVSYSQPLLALGGLPPYTWSTTGPMPPGLNLSSTGLLSGTPTAVGAFSTPIQVMSSESASALDATLNFAITGGRISGTVTSAATSAPLAGIIVEIFDTSGRFVTNAFSDASGNYTSAELTSGTYFARTYTVPGFIDQLFNAIPCAPCSVTTGTPIVVSAPSSTSNVNFALATGGRIAGRVTNSADGSALANIEVDIYNANGDWLTYGFSDASGNYTAFEGLPSGTYYAITYNEWGFIDELYDNVQCGGACVAAQGTPITVTQGVITSGIDFALTAGGRISGRVTNAAGGEALGNVEIVVYNTNNKRMAYAFSDPSGNYTTYSGLPTGTYYARTSNTSGYIDKVFNNVICAGCDPTSGTAISVTAGTTITNIDFALASGGRISGRATAAATSAPIADLAVQIFNAAGTLVTSGYTDASGNYTSGAGLPTGSYFARTLNSVGFVDQLYNNIACASCSVTTGTPVAVTSPTTTGSINFVLVTTASIPTLTIADASVTEGNSGTANALFTVTLSSASLQTVTVAYATEDDDATAGSDYIAASGTLVFAPGQTVKQIAVGVKGNLVKEPDEKFLIHLSGANGALIGDGDAEGTIVNDDNAELTVTPTTVSGGANVTATFTGGPGNRGDWWGVYLVGGADGDYKSWGYLNGQQTMPATGLTGATLSIAMPNVAGTYEVRWWENNDLRLITKSAPITVNAAAAPTVAVTPATVAGGGSVTATFSGGPGNRGDFWAVYLVGDPDTAYKSWGYLNGQHTMPARGLTEATLPIVMPSVAGTYEVRWWANNDLQLIAKSDPITVTSASTVTVTPSRVGGGGTVTTTFADGPGNQGDWWGVYLVGAPDTAYLSWGYLNGLQTMPGTGLTGATLPIVMPSVAGTYEVRWWANNDLVLIAKSGPITVATVTVSPASVATGGSVTTTFTNGPANPGDWWGVYLVGAPDTAYLSWGYLNGLQTMPSPGLSGATLSIAMPGVAGTYEVRWWQNNDLVPIARSAPITVASAATVTATPQTVAASEATTVTFAGGPGNRGDWWGVYLVGAADGDYKSWGYLNGVQTMPGTGVSGATLPIVMPGVPGMYEVRWWANNTLQLIAKSAPITVTSAATVFATPSNVNTGDSITATFANGPGKTGDWWGVYLVGGDPDTAYKAWGYLNGLHTMPSSGLPGATLPIALALPPGTYELRWFENNSLTRVATSGQIVVTTATP